MWCMWMTHFSRQGDAAASSGKSRSGPHPSTVHWLYSYQQTPGTLLGGCRWKVVVEQQRLCADVRGHVSACCASRRCAALRCAACAAHSHDGACACAPTFSCTCCALCCGKCALGAWMWCMWMTHFSRKGQVAVRAALPTGKPSPHGSSTTYARSVFHLPPALCQLGLVADPKTSPRPAGETVSPRNHPGTEKQGDTTKEEQFCGEGQSQQAQSR